MYSKYLYYRFFEGPKGVQRALLLCVGIYAMWFAATAIEGLLIIEGEPVGLLEDYGAYANIIGLFFITILTRKFPEFFRRTFKGGQNGFDFEGGIFKSVDFNERYSRDEYIRDVEYFENVLSLRHRKARIFYFVAIGIGAAANILTQINILTTDQMQGWAIQNTYPLSAAAQMIQNVITWWFFWAETGFILLTNMWALIYLVQKLAKHDAFIISPVSKDKAGGLNLISHYCLHFVRILFFPLLFLLAFTLLFDFKFVVTAAILGYTLFLVLVFVLPLVKIHGAMKRCKNRELLEFENIFKQYYTDLRDLLEDEHRLDSEEVEQLSSKLLNIQSIFELIKKQPVWPYDLSLLSRFFSIILLPIILLLIELVTNADSILYNLDKLFFFFG